jgi:hypothetical protein
LKKWKKNPDKSLRKKMVTPSAAASAKVGENYTSFRAWLNKISQYSYFLSRKARIKKFSTE